MSPKLLEIELCADISRGRRTTVDVRQEDHWVEGGIDVEVDGPEVVSVESVRQWVFLLDVADEMGKFCRNFGDGRHGEVSRMQKNRRGERRGRIRRARSSCPHLKPTA